MTKGLVLGIYSKDEEDGVPQFTSESRILLSWWLESLEKF
jgi:hypothetical protein